MASSVYLQDFKERPQAQTEQYDQTLHYGIAEPTPHLPVSDLVDIHDPNTLPAPNSAHDRQSAAISDVGDSYNPYSDSPSRPTQHLGYDPEASLVHNAADYGVAGGVKDYKEPEYMNISTAEAAPLVQESKNPFTRFFANDAGRYPLEQRIDQKRRGMGRQRWPVVAWTLTVIMVAVLIYELVLNSQQQGSPVSFKPVVNPMLGPSTSALIFAGARFPACMKDVQAIPITSQYPCMNDTANPPTTDTLCTFESLCGFGGISANETPNQWWRFITPIFLHAGIIHLLLNMLAQMTAGAQVEREMGSAGFTLVYFAGGIFGNIFGGNFNLVGVPSVGASGALFSTVGVAWVDLLAHWNIVPQPRRRLVFMIIELVLGVAMGFIPYIDNFVHLGGLFMGLIVGMLLYPIISLTPRHKTIVWVLRIASIPVAIVLFVVLIRNFYTSDPYAACRWCRYISCIPTSVNNHCKGTGLAYTTSLTTPN